MEWHDDAAAARRGDAEARARLLEYLTPFAHAVLLSVTTPSRANALTEPLLEQALATLPVAGEPRGVGAHVLAELRAKAAAHATEAVPESSAAARLLVRVKTLPQTPREVLLLRLVAGAGGEEIAAVLSVSPKEVRRAMTAAVDALEHLPLDEYLWSLEGEPSATVVQWENQLALFRFDAFARESPTTGATFRDLDAVQNDDVTSLEEEPTAAATMDLPTSVVVRANTRAMRLRDLVPPRRSAPPVPKPSRPLSVSRPAPATPPKEPDSHTRLEPVRRRWRPMVVAVGALLVGGGIFVHQATPKFAAVVVASRSLEVGAVLEPSLLRTTLVPQGALVAEVFGAPRLEAAYGATLQRAMQAGEPLMADHFVPSSPFRALTLTALARAGEVVDVTSEGAVLISHAVVTSTKGPDATLLVTEHDAARVSQRARGGAVTLSAPVEPRVITDVRPARDVRRLVSLIRRHR